LDLYSALHYSAPVKSLNDYPSTEGLFKGRYAPGVLVDSISAV